ncbi:hypothetical protein GCM10007940_26540 [Portibacter lacus]|uniref:DUF4271 domain-containing protein n=2 Tax=Portibacter lacus TaxID=1099794 RepID=A0AA37SQY1_9BACT|nr:hypothetical protein GCM10007940_26540 [Portibacter lacus]
MFGQDENPFDIQSRIGTVVEDSLTQTSDSFSLDKHVSFVERRQLEMIEENPFNVSHIPVKKINKIAEVKSDQIDSPPGKNINKDLLTKSNTRNAKFLFWFFLIQLLLLTSVLGINREFIKKINRSISNDNFAKLVSRDYNGGFNALFVIMYVIFIISLSIFIYLAARHYVGISGFSKFLVFLLSVSGIYLFRHIFLGFQGFVFPFSKTTSYYNFMIILFNSYLGLLLIPVNLTLAYSPEGIANISLYIGMGLIIVLYLLRFLRGSLHAYTFISNHLFHFFLYLCTCEIAPIFILVRFLSNSFSN